MVGPAWLSRTRLRVGLGVLAAVGMLLVVGRLAPPGSAPSPRPEGDGAAAPQRLGSGVDFNEAISGLVADRATLWVSHDTTVDRLDPRSLRVTATVSLPASATLVTSGRVTPIRGLAAGSGGGVIWVSVANSAAGLVRIDAASARVVATVPVAGVGPAAVSDEGSAAGVWVVCCGGETFLGPSRLVRVDPATNRVVAQVLLDGLPDAVGVGPSGVWVRGAAGPVWRIDPASNRVVAKVTVPHGLSGTRGSVLVGHDAVWVSDPASRTVVRIDPRSNRVVGSSEVGGSPLAATADGTVVAASGGRVLGLRHGTVNGAQVKGLNGDYATALAVVADTIWVAETDTLFHLDRHELR
jgi:DNA-binding beta-propeller fold protein YncE